MSKSIFAPWLVGLAIVFLIALLSPVRSAQNSSAEEIGHHLQALHSNEDFIVYEAVRALGQIGTPAIPHLVELFETGDMHIRYRASEALNSIGEEVTPVLLDAIGSESPQVRWMAAYTLRKDKIAESFKYAEAIHYALLNALQDPDPGVRIMAAESLWEYTDESAMPAFRAHDRDWNLSVLVKDLRHPEKEIRLEAVRNLAELVEVDSLSARDIGIELTRSLEDPSPRVRAIAAYTLGQMGAQAEMAIPELMQALKDPNPLVRGSAATALGFIGEPAKGAIPSLQHLLEDSNQDARGGAAIGLAALGEHSDRVIVELREELRDSNEDTREQAALELGAIGSAAKAAVPELRQLMGDIFPEVRRAGALALGRIGEAAGAATPELVFGLSDRDALVRTNSARALGRVGKAAETAVPDLRRSLKDRNPTVRAHAARSLGLIGLYVDDVLVDLNNLLEDPNPLARKFSAEALAKISISIQEAANALSPQELDKAIADLEYTRGNLVAAAAGGAENKSEYRNAVATVDLALDSLGAVKFGVFYQLKENWFIVILVTYLFLLPLFWRTLLWLRPLWLFRINHALEPYEFAAPRMLSDKNRISTRYLILVGFYYKHPRVLDAWVETQLETMRDAFLSKSAVKQHSTHVPLPLDIDGDIITGITPGDLVPTFSRATNCLLIWGEGGIGKMNTATRISHMAMAEDKDQRLCSHAMIPIIVDRKLGDAPKKQGEKKKGADKSEPFDSLVEFVRGQMQNLMRVPEPLSKTFITSLLKRPSILLVANDLSEKNSATRDQIRPDLPDFPANSLLVTSRVEESLGDVMKTTIHPHRLAADQYQSFLEEYAAQTDKAALFNADDFAKVADRFCRIVGRNEVPVSVARRHADRSIAMLEANSGDGPELDIADRPDNVPELLLAYINEIHPELAKGKVDGINPESAYTGLKAIGWECVKQALRPRTARRQETLAALGDELGSLLPYLIKQSSLIQVMGAARDGYRFTSDVFAEYLAAMHLVETYNGNEETWAPFLQRMEELPDKSASVSFLNALDVCCDQGSAPVPDSVIEKLRELVRPEL